VGPRGRGEPGRREVRGPGRRVTRPASARVLPLVTVAGCGQQARGLAEYPAAESGGDGMQRVGGPGGFGRGSRTCGGVGTDLRGRGSGGLGGELPRRVAFGECELLLGGDAGRFPAVAQLGQGQVGGELPAAGPHRATAAG